MNIIHFYYQKKMLIASPSTSAFFVFASCRHWQPNFLMNNRLRDTSDRLFFCLSTFECCGYSVSLSFRLSSIFYSSTKSLSWYSFSPERIYGRLGRFFARRYVIFSSFRPQIYVESLMLKHVCIQLGVQLSPAARKWHFLTEIFPHVGFFAS